MIKIIARKKVYSNIRYKTDMKFRSICRKWSRVLQALNGNSKSTSTKEFLGIDFDTYRKWIEYQMTPAMNSTKIEIDHVRPFYLFDASSNDTLREAFIGKTLNHY